MATKLNMTIDQGSTFERTLRFYTDGSTPKDLTGFTFRGQLRENYDDASPAGEFTMTVLDAPAGVVNMLLTAATTAALDPGKLKYDVEMVRPNATVRRLFEGVITVTPEVTK